MSTKLTPAVDSSAFDISHFTFSNLNSHLLTAVQLHIGAIPLHTHICAINRIYSNLICLAVLLNLILISCLFSLQSGTGKSPARIGDGPILTLDKLERQQAGVYQCTADNGVGDPVTVDMRLDVLCKYWEAVTVTKRKG